MFVVKIKNVWYPGETEERDEEKKRIAEILLSSLISRNTRRIPFHPANSVVSRSHLIDNYQYQPHNSTAGNSDKHGIDFAAYGVGNEIINYGFETKHSRNRYMLIQFLLIFSIWMKM